MFLSDDELTMVRALASTRGLTASDVFRTTMREDFVEYAKDSGVTAAVCLETVRRRMDPAPVERVAESPLTGRTQRRTVRTRTTKGKR